MGKAISGKEANPNRQTHRGIDSSKSRTEEPAMVGTKTQTDNSLG